MTWQLKGVKKYMQENDLQYNFIASSVGTGGTIAGIINRSNSNQKILGFPALKGRFLESDISKFARFKNWELI